MIAGSLTGVCGEREKKRDGESNIDVFGRCPKLGHACTPESGNAKPGAPHLLGWVTSFKAAQRQGCLNGQ